MKLLPRTLQWYPETITQNNKHPALRPDAHCMKHKIGDVGLWPLVHHIVMFVNMKNVRWHDVVCPQFSLPSRESMIVTFHNH